MNNVLCTLKIGTAPSLSQAARKPETATADGTGSALDVYWRFWKGPAGKIGSFCRSWGTWSVRRRHGVDGWAGIRAVAESGA
jgi:hypothetical protein